MFFQNPIALSLAFIGANIPDYDHQLRNGTVYKIIILGISIFILLYIFNLPYYIGLIICLLGFIFYFSSHRGFTHSFFGIFLISILVFLIIKLGSSLLLSLNLFNTKNNYLFSLVLMIIFISLFNINKNLILPFISLFLLSVWIFSFVTINYYIIFVSIFLGLLSHMVLDSFSSYGIPVFLPFSNKLYHKNFGITIIILISLLSFLNFFNILYNPICFKIVFFINFL